MLVAIYFMDIVKYKNHKDFDRNEAIYVLHTIEKNSIEQIAENFNLAVEEITGIIAQHQRYEAAIIEGA